MTEDETRLPGVVRRWVEGWCVTRGRSWRWAGPMLEVDVRQDTRRVELLLVEPDQQQLDEAARRALGQPDVWVSTFTPSALALAVPPGLRRLLDRELLMSTRLVDVGDAASRLSQMRADGDRATATVTLDGVAAATGVVGVVGEHAVFDQIRTHDDFQRRGLGTDVMRSLTAWAVSQGALTGLLVASVDGQALYGPLGWQSVAVMTTLTGVREAGVVSGMSVEALPLTTGRFAR